MEVIVMKMVGILIELAPYGVFALLTKLFATMGIGTIFDLAAYFLYAARGTDISWFGGVSELIAHPDGTQSSDLAQ
jgi:L-cystine uptake protein TcyP (sodium:dicarboxylate symporter family)